jgi:type IV pilus assembly protein PilA
MEKNKKGFTLIEVLIVIGIIAILAAIVLVAINPSKQFRQANDTQRLSNLNAILNGVGQYMADNKGALPAVITTSTSTIKKSGLNSADLCDVLVPEYMASLPTDPTIGSPRGGQVSNCSEDYDSGYDIIKNSSGRITVSSISESGSASTTVTR